jgi:2-amino-4-hydroxy-6-hydroxymethyldihydropteridine diphosphokinase
MALVFVGMGSNQGDRLHFIRNAVSLLSALDGVKVVALSSAYETSPVGIGYSGPFLNICAAVETTLTPQKLLEVTRSIERGLGRRFHIRGEGDRTIDIDLLWWDGFKSSSHALTLPHPDMFERLFVLAPLGEILCTQPNLCPELAARVAQARIDGDFTDQSVHRIGPVGALQSEAESSPQGRA